MLYCSQLPVLGFNSSSYDVNLIKGPLVQQLEMHKASHTFVVKKSNNYSCISTEEFKFLDVLQCLAPGTNYSKILKAYCVAEEKGYMCYEWLNCAEKLDTHDVPPYEAFYSSLKLNNSLNEEFEAWQSEMESCQGEKKKKGLEQKRPKTGQQKYADIQKLWHDNDVTFRDYLMFYNNLDCGHSRGTSPVILPSQKPGCV